MEELKNNLFALLKKTERFTKTDNLYLFKGGFFLTLSSVATGALSFVMAITLGWLLPKEVYGNYKYLFSILGIVALFTLGGMDTAVTQAVARGQDGSFRIGFRKKLIFSLLGTLTAIAIAVFYFAQGKDLIAYGSLVVGAFLPLWGPFGLYPAYFIGKGQFRNITKANVGVQALVALSIIIT
ncbi:MAG: oligosaccharide flippase family protein, partial [Patescibacteria group bacterium]